MRSKQVMPAGRRGEKIGKGGQGAQLRNFAGTATIVAVSEDGASAEAVLRLAEAYPSVVRPCVGLHPIPRGTILARDMLDQVRSVAFLLCSLLYCVFCFYGASVARLVMMTVVEARRVVEANHEQLVGIGECGLDFQQWAVPTDEHKLNQRWALEQQIRLARYQQHRHGRLLHGPRTLTAHLPTLFTSPESTRCP